MKKVEEGAKEAATRHPPHSTTADSKWEDMKQILQTAAGGCYAQGPRKQQIDGYKELITAKEPTLRLRAKTRTRLVQLGKGKEECEEERRKAEAEQDAISWRLKELTKRAQGIRRRWEKLKRATLEEDLQEAARTRRLAIAYKISRLFSGKSDPRTDHTAASRDKQRRSGEANWWSPDQRGMGPVPAIGRLAREGGAGRKRPQRGQRPDILTDQTLHPV